MHTPKRDRPAVLLVGYDEEENLGLRYLAAFLQKNLVESQVIPYREGERRRILHEIQRTKPILVGFSLIFQHMLYDFAGLIQYLRRKGVRVHFTMGGHFPTMEPENCLREIPGLDSIVRGEGEQTLLDLVGEVSTPERWDLVPGLAFRRGNSYVVNLPRPLLPNLDDLPFPVRPDKPRTYHGIGIAPVIASRGCPYNCSFCSIRQFYHASPGPLQRNRSALNVVDEIDQLFHTEDISIFIFRDDDFLTRSKKKRLWIQDFVRELKQRGLDKRIWFRIACRIDEIETETLENLQEVGLGMVYLGIEAGNNKGLRALNKRFDVNKVHRSVEVLHQLDLPFEYGFMILDPDSTWESVKHNVEFLEELGKNGDNVISFTKMAPYSGTPIARRLAEEGRLKGRIDAPTYSYVDSRVDVLEAHFMRSFTHRNFDSDGLVVLLQDAHFEVHVLRRFKPEAGGIIEQFARDMNNLTRRSNRAAVDTMAIGLEVTSRMKNNNWMVDWKTLDARATIAEQIDHEIVHELVERRRLFSQQLDTCSRSRSSNHLMASPKRVADSICSAL